MVAPNLGQDADFQPPIGRDAEVLHDLPAHRELAGQSIAEAVQIYDIVIGLAHFLQGRQQRPDQQPDDPPVEFLFGRPGVISF